jgi:hypothetical protein
LQLIQNYELSRLSDPFGEIKTRVIQGKTDEPPLLIGKEINKNGEEDIIIQFNTTRSEGRRLEELLTKGR